MFDKDLGKIANLTATGDLRLIETAGDESNIIIAGSIGISFDIIESPIAKDLIKYMSKEYMKRQAKLNEEMKTKDKDVKEIVSDTTYMSFIDTTLCEPYEASEFDRYEYDNICPELETKGLSIKFMKDVSKMFDVAIKYYFTPGHIIGRRMDNDKFLFITKGVNMQKQLQLISPEKK